MGNGNLLIPALTRENCIESIMEIRNTGLAKWCLISKIQGVPKPEEHELVENIGRKTGIAKSKPNAYVFSMIGLRDFDIEYYVQEVFETFKTSHVYVFYK